MATCRHIVRSSLVFTSLVSLSKAASTNRGMHWKERAKYPKIERNSNLTILPILNYLLPQLTLFSPLDDTTVFITGRFTGKSNFREKQVFTEILEPHRNSNHGFTIFLLTNPIVVIISKYMHVSPNSSHCVSSTHTTLYFKYISIKLGKNCC